MFLFLESRRDDEVEVEVQKSGFFFSLLLHLPSSAPLPLHPPVIQQVRVVDPGDLQDALPDRRVRHGGRGGAGRDAEPAAGAAAAAARPGGGAAGARRSFRRSFSCSSFCRSILRVLLLLGERHHPVDRAGEPGVVRRLEQLVVRDAVPPPAELVGRLARGGDGRGDLRGRGLAVFGVFGVAGGSCCRRWRFCRRRLLVLDLGLGLFLLLLLFGDDLLGKRKLREFGGGKRNEK